MWSIASTTAQLTTTATNIGIVVSAVLAITLTAFVAYYGLKWGTRKMVAVTKGGTGL